MGIEQAKPERAALVLMCGRSFSGKSTIAQEIAAALHAEVVSLDAINDERCLNGGQGIAVEEWVRTNAEAGRRVRNALDGGRSVVVDDTSSPRLLRDNWRKLAKNTSAAYVLVYVDTPLHITWERLLNNREQPNRNDVTDDVMAEHSVRFEPPDSDEEHVMASSRVQDMSSLVAEVRRNLLRSRSGTL